MNADIFDDKNSQSDIMKRLDNEVVQADDRVAALYKELDMIETDKTISGRGSEEPTTFTFRCLDCKCTLKAKKKSAGKTKTCPECGASITVPDVSLPPSTPVSPVAVPPVPVPPAALGHPYQGVSMQDLLLRAEADDIKAIREVVRKYMEGDGVEINATEVMHWVRKSAILGDAESQCDLASIIRVSNGDPKESFHWEQKAAEQGFPQAQHNLAVCFKDGVGTPVNLEKHFFWYQKAAENGFVESQHQLAQCFLNGIGTPQDFQQGVYWLQRASDGGHAMAKRKLGAAYLQGTAVSIDIEKGLTLLNEAASMGDQTAEELLHSDEVRDLINQRNGTGTAENDPRRLHGNLKSMMIGGGIGGAILLGAIGASESGKGGLLFGLLIGAYLGISIGNIGHFISEVKEELLSLLHAMWDTFWDTKREEGIGAAFFAAIVGGLLFFCVSRVPVLIFKLFISPISTINKLAQLERQATRVGTQQEDHFG